MHAWCMLAYIPWCTLIKDMQVRRLHAHKPKALNSCEVSKQESVAWCRSSLPKRVTSGRACEYYATCLQYRIWGKWWCRVTNICMNVDTQWLHWDSGRSIAVLLWKGGRKTDIKLQLQSYTMLHVDAWSMGIKGGVVPYHTSRNFKEAQLKVS